MNIYDLTEQIEKTTGLSREKSHQLAMSIESAVKKVIAVETKGISDAAALKSVAIMVGIIGSLAVIGLFLKQ